MRRPVIGFAACLLLALSGGTAQAQQLQRFALDRFNPAPAGDRFFGVEGADPGGNAGLRFMLLGEYAYRPLVLYANDGDDRVGSVVSDQLFLHAAAAISLFDRLTLSANLPVSVLTEGDSPTAGGIAVTSPSGAALGDLRLGARVRLAGAPRGEAVLSLAGSLWLPTGDRDRFAGDSYARGQPGLVLSGEGSSFAYALNGGVVIRRNRTYGDSRVGDELAFGAAFGFLMADRKLQIGPELYGTTTFQDAFERGSTNAEAILGVRYRAGDWVIGGGAGPGLTRGLGTPALRALLSITFAPEPKPEPEAPLDRDRDGILDMNDACADTPGVASENPEDNGCPDGDSDGIIDKRDACVEEPGVASEDPKKNGCPADRDDDGILDKQDACPDVPGEKNADPEKNGCPPDRDGDGVIDKEDACPEIPGRKDPDPEKNGCPGDTDGDGIPDHKDACPRERGKPNADPDKNGCPTMVRVTEKEIVILQQVQFKTASDAILPASDELLQQVSEVLSEHPEIKKIEVQGHTDNRGRADYNKNLSLRRAKSVVKWLTTRGKIEESRLDPQGYGMEQPIADNDTDDGRQKNRRVQFKITQMEKRSGSQE